ncbi:aldehyde dehydrogenase family protein [Parvibaculum sedimenti]|uniref:Aldehyde dehydrogenase family protein n=1 Tax=Parvibaculum sedimenti TaxID=2608632 RepID=A0A6N6VMH8_9HYPH|nr:aldehyde dehydrogenase family protein [Parvibaculum sedimenti]KAB7740222.1 aldehyde dehydrogenase family protein [Parvibaculum sedimenti]
MAETLKVISPVDGSVYVERPLATWAEVDEALSEAKRAQAAWKLVPVAERAALALRFVEAFTAMKDEVVPELAWQMGRPIAYGAGEVRGFEERARYMVDIAADALADIDVGPKEGFHRWIRRDPLGVVLAVAAWNYPYLISVNVVVPAIMAGNAVILKHSGQTPLCAERFAQAFEKAGAPDGLFQAIHMSHEMTEKTIGDPRVDYVAFTGSVSGGHAVVKAASGRFINVGLELGGKDPAYVRPDANLPFAVENLVDGAFFNSGQSCCGKERIYVHEAVYDEFVDGFVDLTKKYKLGSPLDSSTTLGPMVRSSAAAFVRGQIESAVCGGAKALIDEKLFPASKAGTPYLAPQVLVDVNHQMEVMREESFGPVIGIMKVRSDDEAVQLMNDSPYGLTASVWTEDEDAAIAIGEKVETGTFFMNRCDYLDPALPWTGVKDTGRGATLSSVGYEFLTRPKSYHLRTKTK